MKATLQHTQTRNIAALYAARLRLPQPDISTDSPAILRHNSRLDF